MPERIRRIFEDVNALIRELEDFQLDDSVRAMQCRYDRHVDWLGMIGSGHFGRNTAEGTFRDVEKTKFA